MNKYLKPKNYIRMVGNKLFNLFSPLITKWEKKYIDKYSNQPLKHQPVFIIGAPRTGSTILYQTITNQLDVLYVDNLVCKFNKNLFFGFLLSNKLFKQEAHNCFKSNYGDTSNCGLHAPSECGQFWYRWLPRDRHFIDFDDITDEMVEQIRSEITAVINYFNKPLVFNNNNAGMRIRLLKKAFPYAKYIVTDREPLYVAQSLLEARKTFYGTYKQWWSIMPPNYIELLKKLFYQQVVLQHYYINKQMYNDLNKFTNRNFYLTVNYSDFCAKKSDVLKVIIDLILYKSYRETFQNSDVIESKKISLDHELVKLINAEIERLDWNDYKS